jgi:hypothetical protein
VRVVTIEAVPTGGTPRMRAVGVRPGALFVPVADREGLLVAEAAAVGHPAATSVTHAEAQIREKWAQTRGRPRRSCPAVGPRGLRCSRTVRDAVAGAPTAPSCERPSPTRNAGPLLGQLWGPYAVLQKVSMR